MKAALDHEGDRPVVEFAEPAHSDLVEAVGKQADGDRQEQDDTASEAGIARGVQVVEKENPVDAVNADGVEIEFEQAEIERQPDPEEGDGRQEDQSEPFENDVAANDAAHQLERVLDASLRLFMVERFALGDGSHYRPPRGISNSKEPRTK